MSSSPTSKPSLTEHFKRALNGAREQLHSAPSVQSRLQTPVPQQHYVPQPPSTFGAGRGSDALSSSGASQVTPTPVKNVTSVQPPETRSFWSKHGVKILIALGILALGALALFWWRRRKNRKTVSFNLSPSIRRNASTCPPLPFLKPTDISSSSDQTTPTQQPTQQQPLMQPTQQQPLTQPTQQQPLTQPTQQQPLMQPTQQQPLTQPTQQQPLTQPTQQQPLTQPTQQQPLMQPQQPQDQSVVQTQNDPSQQQASNDPSFHVFS